MQQPPNLRILLSEDVSPQDISILVLIDIYVQLSIANDPQPLSVTLLQLIEHEPFYDANNNIIVFPGALDLCNKICKDTETYSVCSDKEGTAKQINHQLLNSLWKIDSVERLDNTVMEMMKYISPHRQVIYDTKTDTEVKFSTRSAIGAFIQKVVASLHLLHFDELFLLFEAFVSYRESTRELFTEMGGIIDEDVSVKENKSIKCKSEQEDEEVFLSLKQKLDEALDSDISFPKDLTKNHSMSILSVSKYDLQTLLNKQISILEKYGLETPQKLKDVMRLMTSSTSNIYLIQSANLSSIPSYYYIRYLECLHELNYQGSLQALHQYFDYMVSNKSRNFYHYALISRATLHQYFDEDEKALDAIEEAISVARENRDNSTLTFVLSWLFNFMRNKPELWEIQNFYHNNNELHLLDFLVKKSKSVSLLLYSLSYHFEALHIIDNNGSMNRYLESLLKATYVSIHDSVQSFVKSMEMSSVLWSRIGCLPLSELYADVASLFAEESGQKTDLVSIAVRQAYLKYFNGDCEDAFNQLEELKLTVGNDLSLYKMVSLRNTIISVKMHLNKERYKVAETIMNTLNNENVQDIELRTELVLLNAQVQGAVGNHSKALKQIHTFLGYVDQQTPQTKPNLHTIMRLNLLMCQILNKSGSPYRAISMVVQLLKQAKRIGFNTIVVEGIITFASILNNLESFVDAYRLLDAKMGTILMVNNQEFISLAHYELARSCLNLYQNPELLDRIGTSSKDIFNKFLRYMNAAVNGYKQFVNLGMLRKCFELESQMAKYQGLEDLWEHSKSSLDKLEHRIIEEKSWGYVI